MPRHVVLIHRYYEPDTPPYAAILARIAGDLDGEGHRVTVLTCQPSYNPAVVDSAPRRERRGHEIRIVRFRVLADRRSALLKLVNACWFSVAVLLAVLRMGRVDTVMAASTPPVLEGIAGRIASRVKGARFIYHHQDIYPEVAQGLDLGRSVLGRVARAVDARTDRASDAVVVLSGDMREVILSRGVGARRIEVLNNFDPWIYAGDESSDELVPSPRLRVLYGGNLGRFQNLDTVFRSLVALRNEHAIEVTFLGSGALSAQLQRLIVEEGLTNVEYGGHVTPDVLSRRMRHCADVGLVSLEPGVIRAAYPSKVMSYLRNSLPVLALLEPDSELGRDLADRGAGWVVPPTDAHALAQTLRALASRRDETLAARPAARRMYVEQFAPERALPRWRSVLTGDLEAS